MSCSFLNIARNMRNSELCGQIGEGMYVAIIIAWLLGSYAMMDASHM